MSWGSSTYFRKRTVSERMASAVTVKPDAELIQEFIRSGKVKKCPPSALLLAAYKAWNSHRGDDNG
jgi:hypothetical protein